MKDKQQKDEKREAEPLFGKKFNLYGGIFLLLLIGLAVTRHIMLDEPFTRIQEEESQEQVDSLNIDNQ